MIKNLKVHVEVEEKVVNIYKVKVIDDVDKDILIIDDSPVKRRKVGNEND